tara:strand:+ start:8692 stop:9009 length:318 start_codon:yes stop_codon:yes gene_type:complete
MPFEQGNNYGKGRPSGASNKSTEIVKKNIAKLLENNIQLIQEDLDQMTPRDRVNALLQFLKFHIPTQKAVELETTQADTNQEFLEQLMDIPEEKFETYYNNGIKD